MTSAVDSLMKLDDLVNDLIKLKHFENSKDLLSVSFKSDRLHEIGIHNIKAIHKYLVARNLLPCQYSRKNKPELLIDINNCLKTFVSDFNPTNTNTFSHVADPTVTTTSSSASSSSTASLASAKAIVSPTRSPEPRHRTTTPTPTTEINTTTNTNTTTNANTYTTTTAAAAAAAVSSSTSSSSSSSSSYSLFSSTPPQNSQTSHKSHISTTPTKRKTPTIKRFLQPPPPSSTGVSTTTSSNNSNSSDTSTNTTAAVTGSTATNSSISSLTQPLTTKSAIKHKSTSHSSHNYNHGNTAHFSYQHHHTPPVFTMEQSYAVTQNILTNKYKKELYGALLVQNSVKKMEILYVIASHGNDEMKNYTTDGLLSEILEKRQTNQAMKNIDKMTVDDILQVKENAILDQVILLSEGERENIHERKKRRIQDLSNDCNTSILQAEEFKKHSMLLQHIIPTTTQNATTATTTSTAATSMNTSDVTSSNQTSLIERRAKYLSPVLPEPFFVQLLQWYDESCCDIYHTQQQQQQQQQPTPSSHVLASNSLSSSTAIQSTYNAQANLGTTATTTTTTITSTTGNSTTCTSYTCQCHPLKLTLKQLIVQLLQLEKDSIRYHETVTYPYFKHLNIRFLYSLSIESLSNATTTSSSRDVNDLLLLKEGLFWKDVTLQKTEGKGTPTTTTNTTPATTTTATNVNHNTYVHGQNKSNLSQTSPFVTSIRYPSTKYDAIFNKLIQGIHAEIQKLSTGLYSLSTDGNLIPLMFRVSHPDYDVITGKLCVQYDIEDDGFEIMD